MAGSSSASPSSYFQYRSPFGDTTLTKVFVGGLAWETPTEKMREYFEQFGEILEAVIITDKNTAKSKGYGFVTFRDPEAAKRAVADANPMIDGRRANCNIAAAGRPRQSPPRGRRQGQGGQIHYPGAQGGGSSYNAAVQGSMAAPPQVQPPFPVMYPSYGYAAYNPQYGYNQAAAAAMYNQQLQQQAQYYQQMYGSGAASSTSPTMQPAPPHHPYYFAYSMQQAAAAAAAASRAAFAAGAGAAYPTMQQHGQLRSQLGPYIYYSSPSSLNQSPTGATAGSQSSLPHLQQQEEPSDSSRLPSQIESHESSQVSSPETEAKIVPSGSPPSV
ncbi:unnamed protein product [Rhodiola kirilowii]